MALVGEAGSILFLLLLLPLMSFGCDSLFYLQRIPSSCMETRVILSTENTVAPNCYTFNWNQIYNMSTNLATYTDPSTNRTFYAKVAALSVLGAIDSYNLSYTCPPAGYSGVGDGCVVGQNIQLVILNVGVKDGKLYAIDVILSGAPFPDVATLQDNQPPFGRARHVFLSPLTIQSSGYFQVCKHTKSSECPNQSSDMKKLPYPLPSNYASGIFGIPAMNYVVSSIWIMDDLNQLLILSVNDSYYYFNRSGFFFYDEQTKACSWIPQCNYQCEIYNYNSRFLDYAGEWIISAKWGMNMTQSVVVDAWIGNAIDAAGVFPIIAYTDKTTGHYLGLDKVDLVPRQVMGATYWYDKDRATVPGKDILDFHPNAKDRGCVRNLTEWTGVVKGSGIRTNVIHLPVILFTLILELFRNAY